jgi:DNA alkylation repair enzyme
MSEPQNFKDYFNREMAEGIAAQLQAVYPSFDTSSFLAQVMAELEQLELKARVNLIAKAMREHLPSDYPSALRIAESLLGEPSSAYVEGMFSSGWRLMVLAAFVEHYGLDHLEESLAAMYKITQQHTAEFTIRPYLQRYQAEVLACLRQWVHDPSEHVRRLVSEGTRTRLPWAGRLPQFIADPAPVLELLEELRDDSSLYVRRSVANNLNDIAKDHPELVVATLKRWAQGASDERQWIIRHALRSLVKQGHPEALAIMGVYPADIELLSLTLDPDPLPFNGTLSIKLELRNNDQQAHNCIIDYRMYFVGARGQQRSKVFKLRQARLEPGERLMLQQRYSFRPITVRRYYPGQHRVEIQVNGRVVGGADFTLAPEVAALALG